jgi:hypothetical protein
MKKSDRQKKEFLEILIGIPVITTVCAKVGISRQTFYRWLEEDPEFKIKYEDAIKIGLHHINDLAESKLINKINESDMGAIKYWLNSRHKSYITPRRPVNFLDKLVEDEVSKIEINIISDRKDVAKHKNNSETTDEDVPKDYSDTKSEVTHPDISNLS